MTTNDDRMNVAPAGPAMTRREALRRGLLGAAGLVLLDGGGLCHGATAGAAPPKPQAKPARAKSVIQIWMWGGPCHLDTFDPKPGAGSEYCGPLAKPIGTNVAGIQVGELLPLLAKQADKYSIIRSMTHGVNSHETASYIVQTGHRPGDRLSHPCFGAIVSLFKGYEAGYKSVIPPYIVLTNPLGRFSESGYLGSKHKPFATGGDPNQKRFVVEGIVSEGVSEERQHSRRELLLALDTLGRALPADPRLRQFDECGRRADEIAAEAGKVFDLSQEKDELREKYGRNTFGQSCLMARRLVEQGVPFVAINYNGWDTHKRHFETMNRKLPEMDKGMAALLQDLADHGLLDSTIVWWGGEFGRTPRVQWEAPWNGGRGHYGNCFCWVVAGGGFKGGQVVGASDARGEEVAQRPVYSEDVMGTMAELLGIDPDGPLPNPRGMDLKVMPRTEPNKGPGRMKELV